MEILKYRKDGNSPWQDIVAIKGDAGKDGYTPVKGVDYFDGAKGDKGDPFTYEDFTEAQLADLKGDPGADYVLTAEDKQEIANLTLALIPSGEGVSY